MNKNNFIIAYDNPNCENCNECCSMSASISKEELDRIINHIDLDKKLLNRLKNKVIDLNNYYKKNDIINFKCIFTSEKKKRCFIYELRPTACKEFHCDYNTKLDLQDKNYTMLNILDYIINKHMLNKNKNEMTKLLKVFKDAYRKYIEDTLKYMLNDFKNDNKL